MEVTETVEEQWTGHRGEERHGGDRDSGGAMDRASWWGEAWRWLRQWRSNGQGIVVRRGMEVTETMEEQWTGHCGEERHGGDWDSGGRNGQGILMRRDMEVAEVVFEDVMDRVLWWGETWMWQRLGRGCWSITINHGRAHGRWGSERPLLIFTSSWREVDTLVWKQLFSYDYWSSSVTQPVCDLSAETSSHPQSWAAGIAAAHP